MSGKVDLIVIGAQLPLDNRFAPCLTIRKIFNSKHLKSENKFSGDPAIMNHRNYGNNKSLISLKAKKIRSGHNLYVRYITRPIIKDLHVNKVRIQLPIHLHYFPRFASIYTPRGRQTLCESRPPDETYNAAIRSIRAANTCEQLGGLAQRCLGWKRVEGSSEIRRINSKENSLSIKNVVHDDILTCHFMQLAAEYYERGFLHNIKYLESIAERYNITKANISIKGEQSYQHQQQQQKQQQQRQRQICGRQLKKEAAVEKTAYSASSSNSRSVSAQSSTSTATTLNEEEQITKRNFIAAAADFSSNLTRRQSITATDNAQTKHNINTNNKNKNNNNWNAIRVKITPIFKFNYAKNTFLKSNNNQLINNNQHHNNNNNFKQFNNEKSMNDYLNANYMHNCERELENQQQLQKQQQQQQINTNNNQHHSALSLLADLANLEIKSEADLHLPKITLTDCCTHNHSIEPTTETSGAFILKQSRFPLNRYNSLELPGEQNYYHSEARPP